VSSQSAATSATTTTTSPEKKETKDEVHKETGSHSERTRIRNFLLRL
jgi:hypothetical protein